MDSRIIKKKLTTLTEHSTAQFGTMTPHHMVEHLSLTVKIAYKIKWPEFEPSEKQLKQKEMLLHTAMDFPKGLQAPGTNGTPLPLKYATLTEAKEQLLKSIEEYNDFFRTNPGELTMHPQLGWLSFAEWEKFHLKHFKHHFEQFGL
ncbi:DUF1569 domain-containing protein [Algoriphagus sp. NG3]|uniref:DUF1569 domain-containing protein n=1 Tax=Algoriphagus sp. NG3 TaxID=3097546 RepID=UPI002A7F9B2D|nr:DUF1569 domain-containing protein [Algoriphagus sp. NG3]WPR75656.1 DUF1569 domain-containing protein [Algoriphagus sp. NG3]